MESELKELGVGPSQNGGGGWWEGVGVDLLSESSQIHI